jgi:hypothetical protein
MGQDLFSFSVHDLMHPLVRNAKLPGKLSLRDTSGTSVTDDDISFAGGESRIR